MLTFSHRGEFFSAWIFWMIPIIILTQGDSLVQNDILVEETPSPEKDLFPKGEKMDANLKAVNLGVDVRGTLESRDWNKEAPWIVLRNRHRWSILKALKPGRKTLVRALAAKRIKRDPSRPNVMDPLKVIREMSETFAVDDPLASLCLKALYEEFKGGRELETSSRLHPGTKTLDAVAELLSSHDLWKPKIADAINDIARDVLKSSPGFYELAPVMLTLTPGHTFNSVLDVLKLVADQGQIHCIWYEMHEAEAPGCNDNTRAVLANRYPESDFE